MTSDYHLGKVLGRGQFGTTRLAEQKGAKKTFACKSIAKRKLTCQEDIDDVRREVQIMHHLKVRGRATRRGGGPRRVLAPLGVPPAPAAPDPARPPAGRAPPQGHENITYLQGAYEDRQAVHLVMDLCSGGELFDRCAAD